MPQALHRRHLLLGFLLWSLWCLWFYGCKTIFICFQSAMRINASFCHNCLKTSPTTRALRPFVKQDISPACHSRISSRLPDMGIIVAIPSSIFGVPHSCSIMPTICCSALMLADTKKLRRKNKKRELKSQRVRLVHVPNAHIR
jgi:hypothetical protein